MTALVTPFRRGEVDWDRLAMLVDRQMAAGTDWLVPCGTTGESPTLSPDEHDAVLAAVIDRAAGKVPILAGTGTNATDETIRRTAHARSIGATGALLVAPYYNRPTPDGLLRHYSAVAEAVEFPLVLYNVPVRTGVDIPNDVVVTLRERFPHVIGIKHATGRVDGVTDLLQRCDIAVLSGDDVITWPLMALGCTGVISVVSNLVPDRVSCLTAAALAGDVAGARAAHGFVHRLSEGLGRFGPNPVPIKTAMALAGLIEEEFRLPLCALAPEPRAQLEALLRRLEILPPGEHRGGKKSA
jgi:4-hydroxy-tetrahydrodipicolinate synthase